MFLVTIKNSFSSYPHVFNLMMIIEMKSLCSLLLSYCFLKFERILQVIRGEMSETRVFLKIAVY